MKREHYEEICAAMLMADMLGGDATTGLGFVKREGAAVWTKRYSSATYEILSHTGRLSEVSRVGYTRWKSSLEELLDDVGETISD